MGAVSSESRLSASTEELESPQVDPPMVARMRGWSRILGGCVVLLGGTVLVGWILDAALLKSLSPSLASMKANAALSFVLLGAAIMALGADAGNRRARRLGRLCAGFAGTVGGLTLSEYLAGWNLRIDELLFRDSAALQGSYPGRMAATTAMCFVALAVALLLIDTRRRLIPLVPALGVLAIATTAGLGYLYGVTSLYRIPAFGSMAVHTAVGFVVASGGLLLLRPEREPTLVSSGAGGLMLRRTLPTAVIVLIVIGELRTLGQRAGYYGTAFGLSVMVLASIVVLSFLLWWVARSLDVMDAQRSAALGALSGLNLGLERRVSERTAELAGSEARFRGVVEAAPDAMVIVDDQGRIQLVNAQTEQLFGYERHELLGSAIEVLVPERLGPQHRRHRLGYTTDPTTREMGANLDLYGKRKDGSEFPVEISLSPLPTVQGVTVSAAIRDVTARKHAEDALVDAFRLEREAGQRLRQVDQLRLDFLSTVSHELRTPLTVITGFSEVLDTGWAEFSDSQKQDFIRRIGQAGGRLSELIGDMLDFSRLESGTLTFATHPLVVSTLVSDAVRRTRQELENHALVVAIPHQFVVLADPVAVARVLDNLLHNAVKFSPVGSKISVRAEMVGTDIAICVLDNGVGIPAAEHERIFERFYRVGGKNNPQPGTGIGLAIVKEFTEALGGRVEVSSTVGEGTEFRVLLPAA